MTAVVEESNVDVTFLDGSQVALRVQVWDGDEGKMECLCDLPIVFADPGRAAVRRLLGSVAQIAAEESRRFAESVARRAADLVNSPEGNSGSERGFGGEAEVGDSLPPDLDREKIEDARDRYERDLPGLDHCRLILAVQSDGIDEAEQTAFNRVVIGRRGIIEELVRILDGLARQVNPPGLFNSPARKNDGVPADFNSDCVECARKACKKMLGDLDCCWLTLGVFEDGPAECEQPALERLVVGARGTVERVAVALDELAARLNPPGVLQPVEDKNNGPTAKG